MPSYPLIYVKGWPGAFEDWEQGDLIKADGVGMGCTLIRRHVMERLPFRCPNPVVCNDWYFLVDCQAEGFTQAHDCGIACGHIDDGKTYWPDPENGYWVEG